MPLLSAQRPLYSRAEYLSDAVVHVLGLVAVLSAVPVLVTLTVLWRGDASAIVGISVYGAALIAMIGMSALYNINRSERWKGLLQRLDHSAIYIKIAGTYTPFTLLTGGQGAALLAGLWGAALAGSGLKLVDPNRFRWLALALYLGMGWAGMLAGGAVFAQLSGPVLALIVAGGLLYTAGVVFYVFDRLPHHMTVWHAFVLAASVLFFAAVTLHMADTSVQLAAL
ncbi:MAG: hemolysin III family protein [Rhodobacteraceae bacterium]|nr:hemolysin III family protein [Paracoccaceae bacterium]